MSSSKRQLNRHDYTVGWISALPLELAAAKTMLEDEHLPLSRSSVPETDHNTYQLGEIGGHNVVMACLPSGVYGHTSAAVVAQQMLSTFPSIRHGFGLMVGIGGGSPSAGVDIRLGDIVVSKPTDRFPGVVQYDFGKTLADGAFRQTGTLNKPPEALLTAISNLQANGLVTGEGNIEKHMQEAAHKHPQMKHSFMYPGSDEDHLFGPSSVEVVRPPRLSSAPHIHYGLIASANQVMKDARTRDRLTEELGILCFEMEAAGLMDHFPCLVIRGICDYSDSHKNKQWQNYAAAVAAAYTKELLLTYAPKSMSSRELQPEGIQSRIPIPKTAFLGRTDEIHQMQECFESSCSRSSLVMWGLSGSGKTQLAIHYITAYRETYRSVLWVDSSSTATIHASFERLAMQFQYGRQERPAVELVTEWLEKQASWIMVFDGVPGAYDVDDREDYDIRTYFPVCEHGHILLVTTSSDLHARLGFPNVQLHGLDDRIGSEILLRCAGINAPDDAGKLTAMAISRKLSGLPLALEQAGAFLSYGMVRMSDFNEYFEVRFLDRALKTPLKKYVGSYERGRTIWTVFEMLYEVLCQRNPDAIKLLHLATFISPWSPVFRCVTGLGSTPDGSHWTEPAIPAVSSNLFETQSYGLVSWICEMRSDTDRLASAIQELETSGFAKFNRSPNDTVIESCVVHALVRAFIRSKAHEEDLRESVATAFFLHGQVFDNGIDSRPLNTLWRHTGELNRVLKDFLSSVPKGLLEPPDGKYFAICGVVAPVYARICRFLGDLKEAKDLWEIALRYRFISEGAAWPKNRIHMHEILEAADVDVKFGSLDTAIQNYELFLLHCDRHFADDDGIAVRVAASLREARELCGRREMNFERAALAQRSSKRNPDDTGDSPALGDESLEQQLRMEFNDAIAMSEHDPWSLAEQAERLASYYQEHGRHGTEERYREILWNLAQRRLLNTAYANSPDKLENLIICYEKNGNIKEKLCGNLSKASQWASERGYFELCDWLLRFEETDIVHALKDDVDETLKEIVSRHCATTLAYWAYGLEDQCVRDPAFRYLQRHRVLEKCIDKLLFRPGTANRLKTLLDKGLEIPLDDFHEFLRARGDKGFGSEFFTDRNRQGGDGGLSRAQEGALDDANEEDYKLRLLAENRDDIDVISGKSNALHISTERGDLKAVRLLLQLGADPSYSQNDPLHWTALHMAASWGWSEIATVLLDAGSDVNVKARGDSPLCWVIWIGDDEHVERLAHFLLERGADPNVKVGQILETPLHMVAAYTDKVWSVSVAKALVDAGADIEATDRDGNTALRVAAKHENQTIVDLLLKRGADPSTQRGAVALFKSLSSRLSNKLSRGS